MTTAATPTRPALRYQGGKWRLAPCLIGFFPAHRTYVEPYCGAASVLLRKPRCYAEVLNDRAHHVVNLFRVLRDPEQSARLIELVRLTPFSRAEFRTAYEPTADQVESARRLIVRSYFGHGSTAHNAGSTTGFRADLKRRGSTPAHDWAGFPGALTLIVERLRGVSIESKPALDVIRKLDEPETLYYVDPPYPLSTRTSDTRRKRGYLHDLTDDDHRELAATLRAVRGMVVISGYPCDLYDRELYPDWERHECAAFADRSMPRTEVVFLSPSVSRAVSPYPLFRTDHGLEVRRPAEQQGC